jgi:2C-methyl-D-erythritol 2,4-cyclodiphosphate synthase
MNDDTTDLDQTDEDILTHTVSDDVLEAAARGAGEKVVSTNLSTYCPNSQMGCA